MRITQYPFDRRAFVADLAEDKNWTTIRALLGYVSADGGLSGIPAGANRYVDRYRAEIKEERKAA